MKIKLRLTTNIEDRGPSQVTTLRETKTPIHRVQEANKNANTYEVTLHKENFRSIVDMLLDIRENVTFLENL